MGNISGIKKVYEVIGDEVTEVYESTGNLHRPFPLAKGRKYIVPGYQREIRWSTEDVQTLINDLTKGKKFLGTITVSTLDGTACEVIDGQQRLTVISMIITFLNSVVDNRKKFTTNLCPLENESFLMFGEALKYHFDYSELKQSNQTIYNEIIQSDILNQRNDYKTIWTAIEEIISNLSRRNRENLFSALLESDLNVIVNHIDGSESQRKFCIDYFIDINDKRKELDNLDIIRAYAFKEDFEEMTKRWVNIQNKCIEILEKVKYSRKELFYHYFICSINEQLDYNLTKPLTDKYLIKEKVCVDDVKFSKGTVVWNMFTDDSFYADLLSNLDDYLDFIMAITSKESPDDTFKDYFVDSDGNRCDSTKIANTYSIISNILRNDDVVPKMMVMKYFLYSITKENVSKNVYDAIYYIDIIATLFTTSKKGKGSEQIASKLIQQNWVAELKELAIKMLKDQAISTDFSKVFKINRKRTVESGQYMAKRFYSLCDSYSIKDGSLSINEEIYKNTNSSSSNFNMEHFIINRDYKYSLYQGDDAEVTISCPLKIRKYIATIANYLILDSEINKTIKNRPVYYKIQMIEEEIMKRGIDRVIPSKRSQYHYYQVKSVFYENTMFPSKQLEMASTKDEKKKLLNNYYEKYFIDEFTSLTINMDSNEVIFKFDTQDLLVEMGFKKQEDLEMLEYETDNEFSPVRAEILEKDELVKLAVEVYNPYYADETLSQDEIFEKYNIILDSVSDAFYEKYRQTPEVRSSNEYGGSDDESFEFSYSVKANKNNIQRFINTVIYACEKSVYSIPRIK